MLAKMVVEQAMERKRLTKLLEEVTGAQAFHAKSVYEAAARLDAREKILADVEGKAATDRDAFTTLSSGLAER